MLEKGEWSETTEGTPQGAGVSPLLANVFLHYVLDLWVHRWRRLEAQGRISIVRYADDFVMGFQHRTDASRMMRALKERLARFGACAPREQDPFARVREITFLVTRATGPLAVCDVRFPGFHSLLWENPRWPFRREAQNAEPAATSQTQVATASREATYACSSRRPASLALPGAARSLRVLRTSQQHPLSPILF